MTREEAIRHLEDILCENNTVKHSDMVIFEQEKEALRMAIKALSQQNEDAISRQATLEPYKVLNDTDTLCVALIRANIMQQPSVNPQEPKMEQFAKWVASEIFDDNWEYNKDAFDELACRKLAKLGIVRAKGDEWELVEPQES